MQIRNETIEDRSTVAMLIARTYMAEGARTIEVTGVLRDMPNYDNKCAFIAEENDKIVAYALFTPLKVGNKGEGLLLAPLAVDTRENIDVDLFLNKAFEKLKNQGHNYVLMHGNIKQYADMGFDKAKSFGIDDGIDIEGVDLLIKNVSGKNINKVGKLDLPACLL